MREPNLERVLADPEVASLGARVGRSVLGESGGWRRAIRKATPEGLLPLLQFAAEEGTLDPPEFVKAILRPPGKFMKIRAALIQATAQSVTRALADQEIAHAFIKGVALAPRYGNLWLRPMSDVDILLNEEDMEDASRAISGFGYRMTSASEVEVNWAPPKDSLSWSLDVHCRLDYVGQFDLPIGEMLARASTRESIPVLAAEDELLVLITHIARHRMHVVGRSECDIAVLTLTSDINWDAVVARAQACRLAATSWVALSCARKAFGARVPREVLARLRPSWAHEAYFRLWLDLTRVSPYRLAGRGFGDLPRRAAMIFLWPALMDGAFQGLAFVARYSVRMLLRTLQRPTQVHDSRPRETAPP